jgi:hypothetical protein
MLLCMQHLFMTNFRPVPLTEHAVFGRTVFRKRNLNELRALQQKEKEQGAMQGSTNITSAPPGSLSASKSPPTGPGACHLLVSERQLPEAEALGKRDKDGLVHLVAEVVNQGHSVLVFCSSECLPGSLGNCFPESHDVHAACQLLACLPSSSAGSQGLPLEHTQAAMHVRLWGPCCQSCSLRRWQCHGLQTSWPSARLCLQIWMLPTQGTQSHNCAK